MVQRGDDDAQVALAELGALLAASRRMAGLLDAAVLAQRAAHEARRLVGTEIAALAILEDPGQLIVRGTSGTRTVAIEQLHIPRGTGLGGRILIEGQPIELQDYASAQGITRDHVDVVAAGEGIRALIGVPIAADEQVLGILYAGIRSIGSVGDRGRSVLVEFARSVGPALSSARQAAHVQRLSAQAERQRIAIELHDTLGQLLFGIGLAARRAQAGPTTSADLLASLADIEAGASRAASMLREALRGLSPATADEALATAIGMDTSAFTERGGVPAHFVVVGEPVDLTPPIQALLLSVVREGLHNVEKYARAASVVVTLHYGATGVGIIIQDDGLGLPLNWQLEPLAAPHSGRRLGLTSLLQRTQRLGGTLILLRNDDGGTTLRVSVPLGRPSA